MLNIKYKLIVLSVAGLILAGDATSKIKDTDKKSTSQSIEKSSTSSFVGPAKSIMSINNLTSWVERDGFFPWDYPGGWNGSFPKGTVGVIFSEGIVWGAKIKNDGDAISPRVNGSTYANGLSAGKVRGWSIDPDGSNYVAPTAIDVHADQQVWRVRSDYLTADLTDDAANFFQISLADVTASNISAIFNQYDDDWQNWPAADGAPYEDVDGNGVYDPSIDVPGFPGASQTIWLVANDLDPLISSHTYGSPPIGLEMQMTLWAYDFASTSPIGNTIFKRTRLIYTGKIGGPSTAHIDTMYISQWSDPDLGTFSDDYVGWDGDLQMGYVYNSGSMDAAYAEFGLSPPAAGYTLLKGPVLGAETLTSSSFSFFGAGSAISDPDVGVYEGTLQWFNLMEGFLPRPSYPVQVRLTNPLTGVESKFWLDGDPVTGTGWIDGVDLSPGDRRMIQTTGPFEMALGDTQDIIIALIAGIGASRLEGINEIRKGARIAHSFYKNGFPPIPVPDLTVLQPNSSQADLTITIDLSITADEVIAEVYNYSDVLEGSLSLFDDGNNSDGAANDGIWGIQWLTDQKPYGMYINVLIISGTDTSKWEHLVDYITTLGPVSWDDVIIVSDNINNDGVINSGEKFSFNPVISNGSNFGIGSSTVVTSSFDDYVILRSLIEATTVDTIPPGIFTVQNNPEQYFVLSDDTPDGHLLTMRSLIIDQLHNRWVTEFQVTVSTLPFNTEIGSVLHVDGRADGLVGYRVADESVLTGDEYEITFNRSGSEVSFNLENNSTNSTLLDSHAMPIDIYSNDIPITEGFKVVLLDVPLEAKSWFYEPGTGLMQRWFSGASGGGEILFGAVFLDFTFWGSSLTDPGDYHAVEIRWGGMSDFVDGSGLGTTNGVYDPSETYTVDSSKPNQNAFMYKTWGAGQYEGFLPVPFEAWDVEDPANPRQLNIFLRDWSANAAEYGVGQWDYSFVGGGEPFEYIWIMATDYDPTGVVYDPTQGGVDLMDELTGSGPGAVNAYFTLWFGPLGPRAFLADDGVLTLEPNHVFSSADVYRFNSVPTFVEDETGIPKSYELSQNYPNPFNPVTTIKYKLPFMSDVKLLIYNILGQEVFRLVQPGQQPGVHLVRWNGKNMKGSELSSGIYFYRLHAGDFVQTRKMVLLK